MTSCTVSTERQLESLDGGSLALTTFEQEIQWEAREFAEQVEAYLAEVTSPAVEAIRRQPPRGLEPAFVTRRQRAAPTAEHLAHVAGLDRLNRRHTPPTSPASLPGGRRNASVLCRIWPAQLPFARPPPPRLRNQDWRGMLLKMFSSQLAKGRFAAPATRRYTPKIAHGLGQVCEST